MDLKQAVTVTCCSGRNSMWATGTHHFSTLTTVVCDTLQQLQCCRGEVIYLMNGCTCKLVVKQVGKDKTAGT